jgi:hypothetical protein
MVVAKTWTVEITRLPLPRGPIGEQSATAATISPPREFATWREAVDSAHALIETGHQVRIVTPDGKTLEHQAAVARLDQEAMKRPALGPGDGDVRFLGRVDAVTKGRFRASCHAERDLGSRVETEQPVYFMCRIEAEGKDWIAQQARLRGFTSWYNENLPIKPKSG